VRPLSGLGDSLVNQLLTMIDGVNSLNNILVIGMTNRRDMIDEVGAWGGGGPHKSVYSLWGGVRYRRAGHRQTPFWAWRAQALRHTRKNVVMLSL
jgi:hypothetical protein